MNTKNELISVGYRYFFSIPDTLLYSIICSRYFTYTSTEEPISNTKMGVVLIKFNLNKFKC